jgi:hypothetical protein
MIVGVNLVSVAQKKAIVTKESNKKGSLFYFDKKFQKKKKI